MRRKMPTSDDGPQYNSKTVYNVSGHWITRSHFSRLAATDYGTTYK